MLTLPVFLTSFLLFILPNIVLPITISPFEVPKVVLAEALIIILAALQLFKLKSLHLTKLRLLQLLFIGIIVLLTIFNLIFTKNLQILFGNPIRLQGIFLLWSLLVFAIAAEDITHSKYTRVIYRISGIALLLGTLILGINQNGRAFGTLGEPNALAATAVFFFPFFFLMERRAVKIASLIATLVIILLADSRSALAALIIELFFIFLIQRGRVSFLRATIVTLALLVSTLTLPFIQNKWVWFENRAEIWQTAIESGFESPIWGHGFGNLQTTIHQTSQRLNNNVQYQVVDSSHNFLLDFWVQGGLLGLLSILGLISLSMFRFINKKGTLNLVLLLGMITVLSFNPVSVVNLLAFWWLIGKEV